MDDGVRLGMQERLGSGWFGVGGDTRQGPFQRMASLFGGMYCLIRCRRSSRYGLLERNAIWEHDAGCHALLQAAGQVVKLTVTAGARPSRSLQSLTDFKPAVQCNDDQDTRDGKGLRPGRRTTGAKARCEVDPRPRVKCARDDATNNSGLRDNDLSGRMRESRCRHVVIFHTGLKQQPNVSSQGVPSPARASSSSAGGLLTAQRGEKEIDRQRQSGVEQASRPQGFIVDPIRVLSRIRGCRRNQ